tara:strand:- start:2074 stop:2547 length:474 start_codon:yes stop_codon:yes gene_type:complete
MKKRGIPMKKKNKLSDVWAVYLFITLMTIIMVVGVANADEPRSRITAEPEFLEPNEPDDGKFAIMINKGILCDRSAIVFARYHNNGYVSAFRGITQSGLDTYILIRSQFRDGRYLMNEMVILEIDEANGIACVISENRRAEYNQENIYLEINPGERI